MKKILISVLMVFCASGAWATAGNDNATSKLYVDTTVATRQDAVDANTANTVMTYTDTAGTVGTKQIYDTSGSYTEQQNALVPADVANAAIMNAINMEFECAEYNPNDETDCWKWRIKFAERLPAGYTELEYIESTGAQWIDTNYLPNNLTSFEIKYMPTAWNTLFTANIPYGCTDQPEAKRANNGLFRTNIGRNSVNRVAWGNTTLGSNINVDNSHVAQLNNWYTDKYLQNKIYINDDLVATSATPANTPWTANKTLWLFARNSNSEDRYPSIMRLGYAKAWEGNNQIFNFIPVQRDSDGELGMYDTVSQTFKTNGGTGDFVAGPVVTYLSQNH